MTGLRSFLGAYEATSPADAMPIRNVAEDYLALRAKKEAALAGWIAWVALQDPASDALTLMHMRIRFGAWVARAPSIECRDRSWFLTA